MPLARIYRTDRSWYVQCQIGHPPSLVLWSAGSFPAAVALFDGIVGYLRGDLDRKVPPGRAIRGPLANEEE